MKPGWTKMLFVFMLAAMTVKGENMELDRREIENATQILSKMIDPKFYDKKARPDVLGPPVIVEVSMALQSFTAIRESEMEFTTSMYLRQEWTDKRLAHGRDGVLSLVGEDIYQIWLPDASFTNSNNFKLFRDNQLVLISKFGDVYFSARIYVVFSCQMVLQKFPMDVQTCGMIVESFAYSSDHLDFKWKLTDPVNIFSAEMAEFDLTNTELIAKYVSYVSGAYKDLIVVFTFKRRLGYYLINFYVPCIIMVILSWMSFWMDRYSVADRFALGITTVLTIVFLLGSGNSSMPRVSYAKAIDWYLMGSFIFVFTTLIACLFVYRFESTGVEKNQSQTLPGRENSSSTVNVNTEAQNDRQTDLARIREELERNLPFSSPDLSHCPEFAMMEAQSRRYYGHGTVEQELPSEPEDRNQVTYCVADSHGSVYPVVRAKTLIHHLDKLTPPPKVHVSHLGRVVRLLLHLPADSRTTVLSRRMNKLCRYAFPGAFLIFNIIYWAVFYL